jgi:hypothetical protein
VAKQIRQSSTTRHPLVRPRAKGLTEGEESVVRPTFATRLVPDDHNYDRVCVERAQPKRNTRNPREVATARFSGPRRITEWPSPRSVS